MLLYDIKFYGLYATGTTQEEGWVTSLSHMDCGQWWNTSVWQINPWLKSNGQTRFILGIFLASFHINCYLEDVSVLVQGEFLKLTMLKRENTERNEATNFVSHVITFRGKNSPFPSLESPSFSWLSFFHLPLPLRGSQLPELMRRNNVISTATKFLLCFIVSKICILVLAI